MNKHYQHRTRSLVLAGVLSTLALSQTALSQPQSGGNDNTLFLIFYDQQSRFDQQQSQLDRLNRRLDRRQSELERQQRILDAQRELIEGQQQELDRRRMEYSQNLQKRLEQQQQQRQLADKGQAAKRPTSQRATGVDDPVERELFDDRSENPERSDFSRLDEDDDRRLDRKELLDAESMELSFDVVDRDGDGHISREEFRQALSGLGER